MGLEEGDELSEQLIEEIYQLILFPRAKEKALSLLQYRNRTQLEMNRKLVQNGYPEIIAEQVMQFLGEYRLIDDEKYVISYIEMNIRKKSRLQIQHELSLKGIDKDCFYVSGSTGRGSGGAGIKRAGGKAHPVKRADQYGEPSEILCVFCPQRLFFRYDLPPFERISDS